MTVIIDDVRYGPLLDLPDSANVYERALATPIETDDCDAVTVRGYLRELLLTLWAEEERFSGKRPFGNSGWQWDLYRPLVRAGFIPGTIDEEWDNITVANEDMAREYVSELIQYALREAQ